MAGGQPTDITHLVDDGNNPPERCVPDAAGWVPEGLCVARREDGSLLMEVAYARGVAHGPYRDFWSDGRVATEGQYAEGVQEGDWRYYDRGPGQPPEVIRFVAGREFRDWDAILGRSQPPG